LAEEVGVGGRTPHSEFQSFILNARGSMIKFFLVEGDIDEQKKDDSLGSDVTNWAYIDGLCRLL
jgi:hypothetical protein